MFEMLDKFLKEKDGKIKGKRNLVLSKISPIGIGAEAAYVLYPVSSNLFTELICLLRNGEIPYKIYGRMSNVLPSDNFFNGVVIRTDLMNKIELDSNALLSVECGAILSAVAAVCVTLELSGFEELAGIPGSIGGSVIGNAGAFGREISDILKRVRVYDTYNDEEYVLDVSDIAFSYRYCQLDSSRYVVLSSDFELYRSSKERIKANLQRFKLRRKATQPIGEKTLGSTFKRCGVHSAGELIDLCGLKGVSCSDAQISQKHAGFIVNNGSARASDVIKLIELCENRVKERYNILLEREIQIM